MNGLDRTLVALAGLCGLLGVALSAMAAHREGGETLKTAAQFLLFHAPAIIGLAALAAGGLTHGLLTRIAAAALTLGLALFSSDLAMRALLGHALLPTAAPAGGVILMAGWLLAAVAALVSRRR